jgi:CHAD domain-containing protein
MAKARDIEGLHADMLFAEAAAATVAVRADELFEHSANVLDTTDIERVHDMRVATRRLRAALEIFEPCFPAPQHSEALGEVKAVADALGERRDADVTIAALERFAEGLAAPDRPGVASLVQKIRAEQEQANAELEPHVWPRRLTELDERLSELVMEAEAATPEERE